MKKVIFEGTVDGVKFDNVKDYNEAVTKAIAEGKNVQASSNTKVVDTADEIEANDEPKGCNCEHCNCNCKHEFILPGFVLDEENGQYVEALYEDFERFLDTENFNSDGKAFEDKLNLMDKMMSEILGDIDKHSELLEHYAGLLDNVNTIIDQDAQETKEDIDDIMEEIQELQDELTDAKHELAIQFRYERILTMYHKFYKCIAEKMNPDDTIPKTEVKVTREPKEMDFRSDYELTPEQKQKAEEFINNSPFLKLLTEIFGK